MSPPSMYRFFVWTLNNYTPEDEIHLAKMKNYEWLLYGHELAPTTGTPHLQGAIWCKKPYTLFNLAKQFPKGIQLFRSGPAKDLAYWLAYCTKEDPQAIQLGIIPTKEEVDEDLKTRQGKRTDLESAKEAVVSNEITTMKQMRTLFPSVAARFAPYCQALIDDYRKPIPVEITLRPWQEKIIERLNGPPDDRKIYLVLDPVGGAGKTTFAKYIVSKYPDAQYFTTGRTVDLLHIAAESLPKIAVFDFTRSMEEPRPWTTIELVKNGFFCSTKYASRTVTMPIPHVVVFTNEDIEPGKLSPDRIHKIVLSKI